MSLKRGLGAIVASLAGATLLSACGSSTSSNGLATSSGQSILVDAVKAISAANSMHMDASTQVSKTERVVENLTLFKDGDTEGTFTWGPASGRLVILGKTVYMYGAATLWTGLDVAVGGSGVTAAQAAKLAGRWVILPPVSAASFATLTLPAFVKSIRTVSAMPTKVGERRINGQQVVGVNGSKFGTLWVATTGTAYPVEATKSASGSTAVVTFDGWNQGSPPTAPAGAETVTQLLG